MISKILLLNFDFLNLPDAIKSQIEDIASHVAEQKFEGTNVLVTNDPAIAETLHQESGIDVKEIVVHNDITLDGMSPNYAFGMVHPDFEVGFLSIDQFDGITDTDTLANQVGVVASHEAGHLMLPEGHSIDSTNLMSDGSDLNESLDVDNGESLGFTDIQKAIMRGDIDCSDNDLLSQVEAHSLGIDLGVDNDATDSNEDGDSDDSDSNEDGDSDGLDSLTPDDMNDVDNLDVD